MAGCFPAGVICPVIDASGSGATGLTKRAFPVTVNARSRLATGEAMPYPDYLEIAVRIVADDYAFRVRP
jgi:hypothetical protein